MLKYKYESIINIDFNILAKVFIEEQFKSEDFNNLENDDLFKYVSGKAWSDAMSYVGRYIILDSETKRKMHLCAYETLKKYINHEIKTIEGYATNEIPNRERLQEFSLGVWQKYSSMVFKYLYCIKLLGIKPEIEWIEKLEYNKCNCPIDRRIARSVFCLLPFEKKEERALAWFLSGNSPEDSVYKNVCWSRISEKEYVTFQNAVNEICNSFEEKIIPLQFDLLFWEPTYILDEQGMEKYRV